jgi:hypothetical protein
MRGVRNKRSVLLAAVLSLGLLVGVLGGPAHATFPYPAPAPGGDPYDYSTLHTSSPDDLPSDLGGDEWKYSSKTACDLYGPPNPPSPETANCSPETIANPQEQHGVTGASVDKAWTTTTGRPDVVIAVVDSGIMWNNLGKPMNDVNNKIWLNYGELPVPGTDTFSTNKMDYDVNGDGVFNIEDYCPNWHDPKDCGGSGDPRVRGDAGTADTDYNQNGIIDPEDLIFKFSDGIDQDGNGYKDDFVGWDSYEDDNDPFDEVQYGHGSGEAMDSTAEANNGGSVGTCPNCMVMPMRVGDSFVADVNDAAQGMVYAVDNGASIIQSALGTMNNSRFAQEAINYAYSKGVALVASAADESAGHHNQPSALEHAITFNSIGEPQAPGGGGTPSYLEFRGCTNFGAYITASVPSNSCSSEAVGRMSGMAGLMYSAARNAVESNTIQDYGTLDGPGGVPAGHALSAEEIDQLVSRTADDINFTTPTPYTTRSYPETKRYGATQGWDPFFGYGRVNARRMIKAIKQNKIPPEADITSPKWFDIVDPGADPATADPIEVKGTVASRRTPKYDYTVQWGVWSWYGPNRDNYQRPDFKSTGVTLTNPGDQSAPISGVLATIDPKAVADELDALHTDPLAGNGHEGPAVDPTTGRGDQENQHLPDKFGVIVRLVATAKDAAGAPITQDVTNVVDQPNGGSDPVTGSDPNADQPTATIPLQGVGTKEFYFHHDPKLFPGFPRDLHGDGAAAPRFADLDNDGVDELIVATSNGLIHAYKSTGGEVPGWPVHTSDMDLNYGAPGYQSGQITTPVYSAILRSPAVGDINRDGDLEVVAGDFQGRLWAWDHDGNVMPGFPVRSNPSYSSPDRADREAGFYENHPELVFGHYKGPGTIPNDPDLVPDLVNRHNQLNRVIRWMLASPTLANIDPSDDNLEILAGAADRHLYAFHSDGSKVPGWPVMLRDPATIGGYDPDTHEISNKPGVPAYNGAKIVVSPAVGDLDGDGNLEISATVNEQYKETPNTDDPSMQSLGQANGGNERLYALYPDGADHPRAVGTQDNPNHPNEQAYLPGWPTKLATATLELLPVVGDGPTGSPIIGNVNGGKDLEIGAHSVSGPGYIFNKAGKSIYGSTGPLDSTLLTDAPGAGANSTDTPAVPAAGGPIFADPTGSGKLQFAAPTAGAGKLADVILPEDQLESDNHLSLWDLSGDRSQVAGFPREVNDLQFLTTPSAADIDGDGKEEILEGSAYNDLHAFSGTGAEPGASTLSPDGWPKFTGGWTVSPPAVGDWNGDGKRDIAHVIREGRLFVWNSNGADVCDPATWPQWGHDGWMTNNVETDAERPRVITDLGTSPNGSAVTLTWTAPGDDGTCGHANSYDVRRLDVPLTNDNFSFGQKVPNPPSPGPSGSAQLMNVARRVCDQYVAIQTYDADPTTDTPAHPANPSAVSNSVLVPGTDPANPVCTAGRDATRLTIFGDREGQTTDKTTLHALLESPTGPVGGAPVAFRFQNRTYHVTTGPDGVASKTVRLRGRAHQIKILALFNGSPQYKPTSDEEAFIVRREDTRTKVTLSPGRRGTKIKAHLRDFDSPLDLPGRAIRFYLNGQRVGQKKTDGSGVAVLHLKRHRLKKGDKARAVFRGRKQFLTSEGTDRWHPRR